MAHDNDSSTPRRSVVDRTSTLPPSQSGLKHDAVYEIHVKGEGARRAVLVTMHDDVESPAWRDIETENCLLPSRVSGWRELS